MDYTTREAAAAIPTTTPNLNAYVQRGQIVLEQTGRWKRRDILQAGFYREASRAGVPLKRVGMFWRLIANRADLNRLALYVENRSDGTDTDFVISYGLDRPASVPTSATRIDVAAIRNAIWRKLDNVDALRITAEPGAYPHRFPFVSDLAGAPWSVFLAGEVGKLDAEAIARLCDAARGPLAHPVLREHSGGVAQPRGNRRPHD